MLFCNEAKARCGGGLNCSDNNTQSSERNADNVSIVDEMCQK